MRNCSKTTVHSKMLCERIVTASNPEIHRMGRGGRLLVDIKSEFSRTKRVNF